MFSPKTHPITRQPKVNARPRRIAGREQPLARQPSKFANKKVAHEQRITEHHSHRKTNALTI